MTLQIVPFYAALFGLLFIVLSVNVIRGRRVNKVPLGTGGLPDMERRVRAHGNFAEYVPLTLLLLAMAEARGAPGLVLNILCVCLLAGRSFHAWGLVQPAEDFRYRTRGMALTFAALGGAALTIIATEVMSL